eukprot:g2546.t1
MHVVVEGKVPEKVPKAIVLNHSHALDPIAVLAADIFPDFKLVAAANYKALWETLKSIGIWDTDPKEKGKKACIYTATREPHMQLEEFEEERKQCKDEILEWVGDKDSGPLLLFPEGCVTSHRAILQYQAFVFGLDCDILPCAMTVSHFFPFNTYNLCASLEATLFILFFCPYTTFTLHCFSPPVSQSDNLNKIEFAMQVAASTAEFLELPNVPHVNFKQKEHLLQMMYGINDRMISPLTEKAVEMMRKQYKKRGFVEISNGKIKLNKNKLLLGRRVQMEMNYTVDQNDHMIATISDAIKQQQKSKSENKRRVFSLIQKKESAFDSEFKRGASEDSSKDVFIRSYDHHKKMFKSEKTVTPQDSKSDDTYSTDPYDGSDEGSRKFGDDLLGSDERSKSPHSSKSSKSSKSTQGSKIESKRKRDAETSIFELPTVSKSQNSSSSSKGTNNVSSRRKTRSKMIVSKRNRSSPHGSSFRPSSILPSTMVKRNINGTDFEFDLKGLEGSLTVADEIGEQPFLNTEENSLHIIGEGEENEEEEDSAFEALRGLQSA